MPVFNTVARPLHLIPAGRYADAVMNVEVISATADQQPVLANLLELYIHDFSEFFAVEIGEGGRFIYPSLHLYWTEPDRHPFLIRVDGNLAGFALLRQNPDSVWDMVEFFILRGYRRHGLGSEAAHRIWQKFPGRWQVRVMESNVSALHFWARAVATFAGGPIAPIHTGDAGAAWTVFAFSAS